MSDSVRIGQIGLGRFGTGHHIRNLLAIDAGVEIAAVCDVSQEALDGRHERLAGCDAFTDPADLIDPDRVDGVIVSTSNSNHHAPCKLALERGVPVMVDKPLTMTVREGEELVALSRDRDVPLITAFTRHFMPAAEHVRQRIRSGALGEIPVIDAVQRRGRAEDPADGGILHRRTVHIFDVIPWLVGRPVVAVEAIVVPSEGGGQALVDARLHLDGGTAGRLLCLSDSVQFEDEVNVYGTTESYRIQKQTVFAGGRGDWTPVTDLPDAGGNITAWFVELLGGRLSPEAQTRADLHSEDGLQALRVLEAVVEAGNSGRRVELSI